MDAGAHARLSVVRRCLVEADFTATGVAEALGAGPYGALGRGETVPGRLALSGVGRGADARDVLVRLFLLDESVPVGDVRRVLPLAELRAAGLVAVAGDADDDPVRAALDLRPYGESDTDWWVVSDRPPRAAGEFRADHVLGVGGASLTLAALTPRPVVGRALDVGTGCGVQALHLTRHAADVTVTDVNPRALELAALTAGLSGVSWHPRAGSLFEPVHGERFDVVVSNPPFVISPGHRYTYRDAGLPADDLGRRFLAGVPAHLADGGWCAVLVNWLQVRGQDWRERVAGWVEPTGCDAWVVQREVLDPGEYAETWLRDADEQSGPRYAERYAEWLAALDAMDAEAVGFGWVVLHRSGRADPWVVVEDLCDAPRLPRGEEVLDWFAGRDAVEDLGVTGLLDAMPRPASDRRVVATQVGRSTLPVAVGRAGGWRPDVLLDESLADLVARLDGTCTVDEALDTASTRRGADRLDLMAAALPALRALLSDGSLEL